MKKRIYFVLLVPMLVLALLNTAGFSTVAKAASKSSTSQKVLVSKSTPGSTDVCYRAHVQNIGWQNWILGGQVAGTTGQDLGIEAIQILIKSTSGSANDCLYIAGKYAQFSGLLGLATSPITIAPDGVGQYQYYERGAIY